MVCPPPPESDQFIRKLLSDFNGATRYLAVFFKGPQGWSLEDVRARRKY